MPETNLQTLLATMSPILEPETYVYVTDSDDGERLNRKDLLFFFREKESGTLVIPEARAISLGLDSTFRCRMITLNVHSSLSAVGFLAAILERLKHHGVPANPVAAFHHDHLFVPADRAEEALLVLRALSKESVEGKSEETLSEPD